MTKQMELVQGDLEVQMEKLNFLLKVSGKKAVKILSYHIDGSDRLWIRVQGKEEKFQFKPEEQDIVLGGKVIEPYLSYTLLYHLL